MNVRNNPVSGALFLLQGLSLIFRPSVRRFVVIPLAINITLFALLIYFGAGWFDALMQELLPTDIDWLRYLLWPVFALAILILGFYSFTIVGNFIAAPFNGMLAEAVERELTGQAIDGPQGLKAIAKDVGQSIASEFTKLGYVLSRMVPLALLFVIPGLQIIAPFVWIAFSAWMLAVSYADFPMGNHGLRFKDQRARLGHKRFLALGFGGIVMLGITVPFLNLLMIPAAVAGATAMWVRDFRDESAG